jgi:hypothetical protein
LSTTTSVPNAATTLATQQVDRAVAGLVRWLETGTAPPGLFAADCAMDLSVPQWRIQTGTAEEALAVRRQYHPFPGTVTVERVDHTERGFAMAFEERWVDQGEHWYARELIRADVAGDAIVDLAVYCTGDWDEVRQAAHAAEVSRRPS